LQDHFRRNQETAMAHPDGAGRLRKPMDAMAHTQAGRRHPATDAARDGMALAHLADGVAARGEVAQAGPAELRHRRVRLTREPSAAALARREVRAAIGTWDAGVDADVAVLLASDLVTNAITRGEGKTITLAVRCTAGRLRVDVYDTWRALPLVFDAGASAAAGPGQALVATLADEWGTFRTPAGMAVYFALDCEPGQQLSPGRPPLPAGDHTWGRPAVLPPGSPPSSPHESTITDE
jgi:hypothetical protein